MLQWPLHNGQRLIIILKNHAFQAFDFAVELHGWISSTQGSTWQCLMISIFNSGGTIPRVQEEAERALSGLREARMASRVENLEVRWPGKEARLLAKGPDSLDKAKKAKQQQQNF